MSGNVDIIDLSGDDRPMRNLPRAGPSSRARRRKEPAFPVGDVIEITDSEDEPGPSQKKPALGITASSSSVWEVDPPPQSSSVPLFLPEDDEPMPGPSRSSQLLQVAPPPPPSQTPSRVIEPDPSFDDDEPLPPLEDDPDPYGHFVAQVLEIIPDVDPSHALALVTLHYDQYKDKVVEPVLHTLFENADYPKLDKKGKRKREETPPPPVSVSRRRVSDVEIDYGSEIRPQPGGPHYQELAVTRLSFDFPSTPLNHIRRQFKHHNFMYAPTWIALDAELGGLLPYKPLLTPRSEVAASKGKAVQREDTDFDLEVAYIHQRRNKADAEAAEKLLEEDRVDAEGAGIECGCCFTENPFDDMIQCPDAHLFCKTCMTSYAETKLGEQDATILCMDQSDCKLPFPESELRRLLTPKLLALYERIKQRKEIEAAGLENLEECPFCEYKVVIENDQERLFRCENADCGAVSCRECKKLDHLPKTCKEMEDDKKLDARHAIEEAMTAALMRNCPNCNKAFLKESGCNKMTCPNCRTMSCYVCRQVITGYEHFNQAPPYNQPVDNKKCPLWDQVEQRHVDEVTAARKKAIEEFKRLNPEASDKDLQVELPKAPPPQPGMAIPGQPRVVYPAVVVPRAGQAAGHAIAGAGLPGLPAQQAVAVPAAAAARAMQIQAAQAQHRHIHHHHHHHAVGAVAHAPAVEYLRLPAQPNPAAVAAAAAARAPAVGHLHLPALPHPAALAAAANGEAAALQRLLDANQRLQVAINNLDQRLNVHAQFPGAGLVNLQVNGGPVGEPVAQAAPAPAPVPAPAPAPRVQARAPRAKAARRRR